MLYIRPATGVTPKVPPRTHQRASNAILAGVSRGCFSRVSWGSFTLAGVKIRVYPPVSLATR